MGGDIMKRGQRQASGMGDDDGGKSNTHQYSEGSHRGTTRQHSDVCQTCKETKAASEGSMQLKNAWHQCSENVHSSVR